MAEKRCYTVKELQKILGVSRPSVYELLKRNEFRSFIVGGKHVISKRSFDLWLDGNPGMPEPEETEWETVVDSATNIPGMTS